MKNKKPTTVTATLIWSSQKSPDTILKELILAVCEKTEVSYDK